MDFFSAIFLGLVQGLAEFLPISSSGHLAFFQQFFGLMDVEAENLFFDVLLHVNKQFSHETPLFRRFVREFDCRSVVFSIFNSRNFLYFRSK